MIHKTTIIDSKAKISNTENPYASVTNERAVELEMPVLAGMVIDRNVQSKDQITAKDVGLFVKDPDNPNNPPVFVSWEKIHNDIIVIRSTWLREDDSCNYDARENTA